MKHVTSYKSDRKLPKFKEYQYVSALFDLETDEGVVPAGSEGTIVDICKTPGYVMVEFSRPVHFVATVKVDKIR